MENSFKQLDHSQQNINNLLSDGYKQSESAIFDGDANLFILKNEYNFTFWITSQKGLAEAEEIIKLKFNQQIENQCQN